MLNPITFCHALADPTRWRIAMLLAEQMLCVCELEDGLRLPQSTLSSHLAVMREAGLLEVERRGKWAFYRLGVEPRGVFEALRGYFAAGMEQAPEYAEDRRRTEERVALRGGTDCGNERRRPIPPRLDGADIEGCC